MGNPYNVLGVPAGASDDEIKKAYRTMSRKYHPDANINNPNKDQAEEKFKEVQLAYDQIMKERQQGYSYGGSNAGGATGYGSYSYGGFGSTGRNGAYGGNNTDSVEMQAAANYISSRHYMEATVMQDGTITVQLQMPVLAIM